MTPELTFSGLVELIREDWDTHGRKWHRPGFHAIAVYRLGAWAQTLSRPLRAAVLLLHGVLYFVTRNLYGIELPAKTTVGRRLLIGHQSGIVIAEAVKIGDDCVLRQNVTIGAVVGDGGCPTIRNRVQIGAGAVVMGGITIGDGAVIGPNAVVAVDVPPGARAHAPPARVVGAGRHADETPAVERRHAISPAEVATVIQAALEISESLDADTPLLTSGLVDSLQVPVLLDAIEDAYGVELSHDDVDAELIDTPAAITALVESRRGR